MLVIKKLRKIRQPGNENDQFRTHQMILYCEIFLFRSVSIFIHHSRSLSPSFILSFFLRFMITIHLFVLFLCVVICSTVARALVAVVGAARTRIILCIEFRSLLFFLGDRDDGNQHKESTLCTACFRNFIVNFTIFTCHQFICYCWICCCRACTLYSKVITTKRRKKKIYIYIDEKQNK